MNCNSHNNSIDKGMSHILDDQLLEKILIESSQMRDIHKIIGRQSNKFVNEGDNYISVTWQEIVKVMNKQGVRRLESIIVKSLPEGEHAKQFIENEGIFKKEIKMYTEVLPKMENLIRNTDKCGERLWPRCIGMKPYSLLLLEDLTAKGYEKVDRRQGLDMEHSLFAFKAIAKFHTLSLVLRDELTLDSQDYVRFEPNDTFKRNEFFVRKVKPLAKTMRNEWEPKWYRLADHLENKAEEIIMKFTKICQRNENKFNVLNHGDPWTSNMLFKYSEFSGKVIGIRFVDFQVRHYGSFAIDLQYILQTSVQVEVMKNHADELLAAYHESLLRTARKLDSTNIVIPTLSNIKAEMNAHILVGLVLAIFLLDMMLVEPSEALNLDTILQNSWTSGKPLSKMCQERMRNILEPYIDSDFTSL